MGVRKRNNRWWVDFSFNEIRYRKPSPENSRAGALAYEVVMRERLARGEPVDGRKEIKTSFKDFAVNWFQVYVKNNNKHSEISTKEKLLRVHLIPYFGKFKLECINSLDIEKYKAVKIEAGLNPKTINNHLTVLRKCLRSAIEWNALKSCPVIKNLKVPPQEYDFLSLGECQLLLDSANGMWRDMIMIALGTGLRFGELIALTWHDIDFNKGELIVRQAFAQGVLGSTKSNKIRRIPLSYSVLEALSRIKKTETYIFTDKDGRPLKQMACLKKLQSICKKADLRKIGWHTLRHTFASHLAQSGANLVAVQNLLGHSDIRTTMRYAHINGAALREAINILDHGNYTQESTSICHNSVTTGIRPSKQSNLSMKILAQKKEKRAKAL